MNKREAKILAIEAAADDLRACVNTEIFQNQVPAGSVDERKCIEALRALVDELDLRAARLRQRQDVRLK